MTISIQNDIVLGLSTSTEKEGERRKGIKRENSNPLFTLTITTSSIHGAIKSLQLHRSNPELQITITTDNKYLYNAATIWIDKWKTNGWITTKNTSVIHKSLWEELDILQQSKKRGTLRWVFEETRRIK